MSITIKSRTVILAVIIALLGIFFLGNRIGQQRANRAAQARIAVLNSEINRYIVEINNKTVYIAEKDQEIISQRLAIRQGDIENAELKALNIKKTSEVAYLKGQVKILKDSIGHTGNVIIVTPCDSIGEGKPAIELPFTFRDSTLYYDLMGGFNSMGKMRIDLTVPISMDVWFGLDRDTKEYKAVVTTDNPVVNFTDIRSLKFDLKRPTKFGIGFQAGYGLSIKNPPKLAPYVGIGLSYNVLRF